MVNLGFTRMLCIVYVLCAISCCTGKIEFVRYPQNAVVNLGQSSFTLSCLAKSTQKNKLHYKWTLNGHDVRSQPDGHDQTGPSLVLHNVRHGDYGWYQCIVSDPVNTEEKVVSPKAYVIQPFLGSFQNHPESGIVRVGESVVLSCLTGRSVPPARVYWEKDGIIFKSGTQKSETTKIIGQPLITETNMTLKITATDVVSGEYICVAENNMTGDIYRSDPGSIQSAVLLHEFNKEPEDMTVQLGDHAKLACSPPHSVPPATVTWYKDNKKMDFNSDSLPEDSDWDLKFESVRYDDSGEYFCVAFNNYTLPQTRTSLTAILSVVGPPQILEAPSSQNVIQKMSMKLVCRVEGHPIPVVSWYHNDMKLSATSRIFLRNSNQEFWVTNVNKADEGEYRCETWNKYGNRSAVATVHVAVPPVILLPIGHVIAEENSTKILNCQVYGDPHPLVFWAKDGVPLLTINSRLKVLDTGLKIINISHADEGNYTCTAVNDAGNQSTTGVLSIEAPAKTQVSHRAPKMDGPHFVKYPVDTVSQIGEPVTFSCDTDDDPKPHIYWTFNNTVSFPPTVNISKDGRKLYIKSMSWKEIGKYMCFAENLQAVRNKTAHLYLRVPSKILGIMGNTILAVDDTLELVCKTSGLPSPKIYWVHNGRRIKTRADGRIRVLSPNKLVVKFITRHDTGNYTCVASTRVYNVSSTVPVCIVGQPKAPTLTKLYATSSTSIMLEWQPAEQEPFTNVTGYIISYKPESLYKPQFKKYMDNIPSSVTAQLVTGLEPAKTYVFTITARNRVGEGSPSDMKSASTWQAAPSEPIRLQVVQTSPVSIYLSWWRPKYLHGNLKKYQLYRDSLNWTQDQIVQELVNIDSPFISHTVRGLHPYTTYIFRVRAANVENGTELWGNFSSPITVTTEIQAPSVSPLNFTVHQIMQRTLEISWEPPPRFYQNGPLTHYVVNYKVISSIDDYPDINRQYFPVDSLKANITGLLSGMKYSFEIAAENEAGRGPVSNPVYFTTSPEAPTGSPQNLIAKSSSPTKIEVFWNPPNPEKQNSKISSYVVEISKPGGTKDIYIVHDEKGLSKHPKSVFHKTIGNLHPWTTYKVRVAAITKEVLQGQGPFSFVKTIRTLETVPGPVLNFTYEVIGTSIHLAWQPPVELNGNIFWYHISFKIIRPLNSSNMDNITVTNVPNGDNISDSVRSLSSPNTTTTTTSASGSGNFMTSNLSAVISSLSPHSVYNVSIAASTGTSGLGTPTILSINTGSALSNESHHSLSSSISSRSSSSSTKSSVTVSITSKSTLSHTTEGNKVTMKSSSSPSDTQSHTNANTSLQDLPVIVAGSLTAGLVLIFLLGVLIYHCLKNKKRRQKEQNYMMFYAYEDIGSLHPEDPARNNRLQQTQLTSPEVRKATSYGCKQDVSILKTQDANSDGPSAEREIQKIDASQDKNVSPGFVHPTFWPKELKTSFGVKHIGIQNLGFEEDSSGSITFGPPSPEDSPRLTAEEVYSRVDTKKKNRMRNESAAAIALMKNSTLPHTALYSNDTDCLIHNESEVVYDERTAL